MFAIAPEISQLVQARAELLASADHSPAFTAALNRIEAKLDDYPWRLVMAAEAALKAQAVADQTREVA